ncbi:uncharacterized protein LOC134467166 [Engraulis encrasicolus]|uniref:uncharacterized protein LOC134467166 n=1 Tax=Engraulis encrasicolus TaxID=184585 RepID=UPI002FD79C92
MGKNLSCCMTSSGDGPQQKCQDSSKYDDMLQLLLQQEAKIAALDLLTKKLQEELSRLQTKNNEKEETINRIVKEKQHLRCTISTLQTQNDDKDEIIKRLTRQLAQQHQATESRTRRAQGEIRTLHHTISELENREMSYRTTISSLEKSAHRRLLKTSSLQRELSEKRGEIFSLHHRLIEYMDKVAELRGTPFIPLPSYPPGHKPPHKRVRDSWRKMWAGTRLYVIAEEKQTTSSLH